MQVTIRIKDTDNGFKWDVTTNPPVDDIAEHPKSFAHMMARDFVRVLEKLTRELEEVEKE